MGNLQSKLLRNDSNIVGVQTNGRRKNPSTSKTMRSFVTKKMITTSKIYLIQNYEILCSHSCFCYLSCCSYGQDECYEKERRTEICFHTIKKYRSVEKRFNAGWSTDKWKKKECQHKKDNAFFLSQKNDYYISKIYLIQKYELASCDEHASHIYTLIKTIIQ